MNDSKIYGFNYRKGDRYTTFAVPQLRKGSNNALETATINLGSRESRGVLGGCANGNYFEFSPADVKAVIQHMTGLSHSIGLKIVVNESWPITGYPGRRIVG